MKSLLSQGLWAMTWRGVTRRGCLALCLYWVGVTAVQASPLLRCEVTYAGQTQHLTARPVSDPYTVEAVDIGGRFYFKMVMVEHASRLDRILIYTYLEQDPRPVMLQEIKYLPPFRTSPHPYLLTGEQHVYAGPIERELIYRCWLSGVRP
jgi:hypothetical protein